MSKYSVQNSDDSDLSCIVQSISNETAEPRLCIRTHSSSYYSCQTCESSIAHEEQCVHSLVANKGKHIKNQFALRHFRREKNIRFIL